MGENVTLQKFLTALRRRIRLFAAVLVLFTAGSVVLTTVSTPTYSSTAGVFFSVRSAATVDQLSQAATFTQTQLGSYAELAVTPRVLRPVADELGVPGGVGTLAAQVTATPVTGTVLLDIRVVDTDAERSARIANAVAGQLITVVEELAPVGADGASPTVTATVVAPAPVPTSPSTPKTTQDVLAGAVLGLVLGILLVLLREALNTRVRGVEDLAGLTRVPLVGVLGAVPSRRRGIVMEFAPHSSQAEAHRQLRTNLQFLDVGGRGRSGGVARVVSVTSALAGEGKSTTAANLAIALAETSARVLLVDADLRRPSLARLLGLEGAAGLTTVLLDQARLDEVVQPWGRSELQVLTSGPLPPNPAELLGSPSMRALLEEARAAYDYVVVDSSPLLPVADGAVLATQVDGVLVLANVTRVRSHQLVEALAALDRVDAAVLGVVLNQVARDEGTYGYAAETPAVPEAGGPRGRQAEPPVQVR